MNNNTLSFLQITNKNKELIAIPIFEQSEKDFFHDSKNYFEINLDGAELSTAEALKPYLVCESKADDIVTTLLMWESVGDDGVCIKLTVNDWNNGKVFKKTQSFLKMQYSDFYEFAERLTELPQTESTSKWFDAVLHKGLS